MKLFLILSLSLVASLYACADELSDLLEDVKYRKERIQKLMDENSDLEKEIAELDQRIAGAGGESGEVVLSYGDVLRKALAFEKELEDKSHLLAVMKSRFIDKIPLKKGDDLGNITNSKGTSYQKVIVSEISDGNIVFVHSGGISQISPAELPASKTVGWNIRPVTADLSGIVGEVTGKRPSSVLKSAAYADRRKELAKQRAQRVVSTQSVKSGAGASGAVNSIRSERELERAKMDQEIAIHNKGIERQYVANLAKIDAQQEQLAKIKIDFMKETMAYDAMRIKRGRGAQEKERERRHEIVKKYEEEKHQLTESIYQLETGNLTLLSKRKRTSTLPSNRLSLKERKKRSDVIRAQAKAMEKELKLSYDEQFKLEDERLEELHIYDNAKIKPDRKNFERKIAKLNDSIIELMTKNAAEEKKIRELRNTIPNF